MKINKKIGSSKKKLIILGVSAVVLVIALLFFYLYKSQGSLFGWAPFKKTSSSINYEAPTDDQKKTGTATKENSINTEDSSKPNSSGSDQPPAPVSQPNGKSKVDIAITTADQYGSTLRVRSDISTVTSSGTCTLTLTKSSQTVTKTAGVQALPSSTTCQGFDVPTSELSPGTWQLTLHFESNELVADTTKAVTIQ